MNWSKWVRQIHRWLSIAFTVAVIIVIVSMAALGHDPAIWVFYLPLLPLVLLLCSGLYLFVLPYAINWRSRRSAAREE